MRRKAFILLLLPLLLSGCWDANEPERMYYVQGIGIDYKNNEYIVYLQIVNPSILAKSESAGKSSDTKVAVAHGSGKTINDANFKLYQSSQRRLFWGHISYMVFTEDALKVGGFKSAMDRFDRYRETRYGIQMYATKEPLGDLLTALPPLGISSYFSRLSDPEAAYKQNSIVKPVNLRESLVAINEPPYEAHLPFVSLARKTWQTENMLQDQVKMSGIAFITKDTVKAMEPFEKIQGVEWLNPKMTRDDINLKGDLHDVSVIADKIKVKKEPIMENGKIRFDITLKVEATLAEITKPEQISRIEKATQKQMIDDVKRTYAEGLKYDVDIYRLSEVVYRKKNDEWKKVQKDGKIPLEQDTLRDVKVEVSVKHGEKQRDQPTVH